MNKENKITKEIKRFLYGEEGIGTVEMILILVGILTTYYGVSIRCIG